MRPAVRCSHDSCWLQAVSVGSHSPAGDCHERYVRNVACASDSEVDCAYLRLMTSNEGKEHTMKRTAVIFGVAAVMGVFASAAAGSTGQAGGVPVQTAKPGVVPQRILHTRIEGGRTLYRLGNKGAWME